MKWSVLVLLALALSCDGAVQGLGDERVAIVTLQGRLDGDLVGIEHPERLRVGVVWTAVPVFVPYCHAKGPTILEPERRITPTARLACRDPFEVVPGRSGPTASLRSDGTFTLDVVELPGADLMVGTRESRVAYGSIVVFLDEDGDGSLDTEDRCRVGGRGGRGGPDDPRMPEQILAASFWTLSERQLRMVFVEGTFDSASQYYPHAGCTDLPSPGFSLWDVPSLHEPGAECSLPSFEEPIVLRPNPEVLRNLSCEQSDNESFHRPPRSIDIEIGDYSWECTEDGAIAAIRKDCPCPGIRTFSLVGCYDSVVCEDPDWDLRDAVPDLWPCPINGRP